MIEELKTFICVVECNNFTKAGEKIGLSQPSVSLHIKNLEQYFETTLIQRSVKQKKIFITKQGKLLYEKAKKIINILEETKEELSGYESKMKGVLHIGCSFTLGEYFIPSFLGVFREKYKDIELYITIENTSHICEKVENYELDLGLIEGTVNKNKFTYESIYEDNIVLAVGKNNPILKNKISKEYIENQVWIGREKGSGSREQLDLFLLKNKISPKSIIVLGSNYAIKETVKNNLGITFISSLVVEEELKYDNIRLIPMDDKYTRDFSYIYPKGSKTSTIARVFIDMLKEYSKNYF
ncbi:HTH-type transcriptional regulator [Gottschalkia acidurici 9a]|uniref:HTH-type transcriptional regulator n=1 Tax=Gottschalkia acidurici (strain ATCC 7906 / DSM 604 / BCRC 14475 / CIP 104303 / KCTC 5404 / NCIMB 10678 / 9a) TaxID=1128398 RepID=K0AZB5_GOTA9|nr:LysR family transcriptional regulator [Gottschalkia acidurici]AFS79143.1 HTH-type transcriptional regulator [Gottschalkia acidurici 9a]